MAYKEGWILVNKIPTHVITWGCWIEDLKENQELIFMFAGNPGIPGFYVQFLETIYDKLNIPIWIVSHAGHELPENPEKLPEEFKYEDKVYSVQDQVDHKLCILKKYVPKSCKLYTIGHSLGCYLNLEVLKHSEEIADQIQKCYMLFPMIERMAETENARTLRRINNPILNLGLFMCKLSQILPFMVRYYIAYTAIVIFRGKLRPDPYIVKSVMQFMSPSMLHNMHYLGMDEMQRIRELDIQTVKKFKNKLKFYYGVSDGWCPIENYENMIKEIPDMSGVVCSKGIEHAFVLKSSHLMAEIVCDWFKNEFKKEIDLNK